MPEMNKKTLRNVFLVIAASIVLYWFLHDGERVKGVFSTIFGVLSPFFAGAGLAFVMNVPMRAIEGQLKFLKEGTPRRLLAILLTILAVLLIVAVVFLLLIPQVIDTVQNLIPQLQEFFLSIGARINKFLVDNPEVMQWLQENTDFKGFDWASLVQKVASVLTNSVTTIVSKAFSAIGNVFSVVANSVIAIVFAIYCLFQKETLARQGRKLLYAYVPEKVSDYIVRILRLANTTFSRFLSGQCVEVCILGCLFAISMAIFKMPYIPLVSVLVAVTAFIPIVGAFVGCFCGAFFILVSDPLLAVWFVIMFLIIQQIENNLIYPRVVGTSIGLSGMWVLVAVTVGGALMGVAGMFLMIPFASVIYTLLQEYTNKRLGTMSVSEEKLIPVPPELGRHPIFQKRKEKREKFKLNFKQFIKKK